MTLFEGSIVDLAEHTKKLRSAPEARKDTLLTRYRAFSIAVLCATNAIKRAQENDDPNARELVTLIAVASIDAAQALIGDK